jgi:hypothetical protein
MITISKYLTYYIAGIPNLGDASPWGYARDVVSVIFWVHLYQWGDAIDVSYLEVLGASFILS